VKIPDNTLIVGLYNTSKPGVYQGADFFSRFDLTITLPFNKEELVEKAKDLIDSRKAEPEQKQIETEQKTRELIDLYNSINWRGILLGKWNLEGKNLVFEEGELFKARATGKEIELKNAPWELEEFRVFWQQARLNQKIETYGKTITLPPDFKVYASEGYAWESLLKNTTWNIPVDAQVHMLNPGTFNQYFKNYQSIPGDQITLKTGWIEMAAGFKQKNLSVLLTTELSEHQWAGLLDTANKYSVQLNIQVAPGVSLPKSFPEAFRNTISTTEPETKSIEEVTLESLPNHKGHVLFTEDLDYAIAALKDKHPNVESLKIIDISEAEAQHLLVSRMASFNKKTLDYKFIQKLGPVWEALEKGETVILKGHFKEELVDALASLCSSDPHFWLNGQRFPVKGKLVLLTDKQNETQKRFGFASAHVLASAKNSIEILNLLQRDAEKRYKKSFSPESIQAAIKKVAQNLESSSYSFVKLQSLLECQLCYPYENPETNWQGLYSLKESTEELETKLLFSEKDEKSITDESNAFEQIRLRQINDALKFRPFVFIAGSTGVGKSTFIKQTLAKQPGYKVFFESQLEEWAKDKTPNIRKTLFIDEANIGKGNLSAFEGLFETPPKILIGKTYHTLSPEHKVIFAGNPVSYGRKMPTLFERHGGSVIFKPLSSAHLYTRVLKPLLAEQLTEEEQKTVSERLLQVYQYIMRLSKEHMLISPRELQMMALLALKKYQEKPQPPLNTCIAYAVHRIGSGVVPEEEKLNFQNTFPPVSLPIAPFEEKELHSFVLTPSRDSAYQQIVDFLGIRELKQSDAANALFKYAGLGGMVFEGEPGVGKSHFVIDTLVSEGFKEVHWKPSEAEPAKRWSQKIQAPHKQPTVVFQWRKNAQGQWKKQNAPTWVPLETSPQKIFYVMPVSMQLEEKKKLLLKAFDEGAVVVVDEINSNAMMEDLLNDLLMGIYGNKRPKHPGFMIIGTQNPIAMEGRIAASVALERRSFKVIFPPYDILEMKEILHNKSHDKEKIDMLVEQYRKARLYAIQNNKHPMPTFRDLLKIAGYFEKIKSQPETKADRVAPTSTKWLLKIHQQKRTPSKTEAGISTKTSTKTSTRTDTKPKF
jgi:MoxR-like ATPase